MGFPMAGHLSDSGHEVSVYNRTSNKSEEWESQFKGKACKSPREVAIGADFVMACVGNDDDLREICLGEDGAFKGMKPGTIFVDHTTVSAKVTRELANISKGSGVEVIDAPVSGGQAGETIDAEGHVVTPGFVDAHTHMDAQIFWDQLGSCSCYHGVTTAVMGNCGFTLAPCREAEADLVFRNLERAEDISRSAMLEGINWQWETYPEYMDVIDALPKGINKSRVQRYTISWKS